MPAPRHALAFVLPDLLRTSPADSSPADLSPAKRAGDPAPTPPRAPGLARLIAAAGAPAIERDGLGAALAQRYGIARQTDWPLAPIRAAALGVEADERFWLAADPVTLVAGRDDVRLVGAVTDLSAAEAGALLATLNAHFAGDGLEFVAPRPDAWFVGMSKVPAISTRPLESALGRTLRGLLADGPDAGRWRRWQNEIQMLLFDHPVNIAREARGQPGANSVWFADGGTPPARPPVAMRTYAGAGLALALAAHAGDPARALPPSLDAALADAAGSGDNIATIVFAFDPPLDLADIDRAWTAPAWHALARGTVDAVAIVGSGEDGAAVWTARRPGAWQRFAARFGAAELAPRLVGARAAFRTEG